MDNELGAPACGASTLERFLLDNIAQWVLDVVSALGYVGLALLLIAENLFPRSRRRSSCRSQGSWWVGAT